MGRHAATMSSRASTRALSEYAALAYGVETKGAAAPRSIQAKVQQATQGASPISETSAPAFEVTNKFLYQSYFDNTLGAQAILSQAPGEPIVNSTIDTQQVTGYSVGLHPSSEAPIAIRFFTGGQQGASAPYRLAPGQVIRPHGKPGDKSGAFSGFQWGLPFGWLGGGNCTLVVLRTPDAEVAWNNAPEVIYHRIRLQIVAPASIPISTAVVPNWPHRFPWPNAVSGSNNLTQRGQPGLAVTPTKVAMRLRLSSLSAPAEMRVLFYGSNDLDLDSTGAIASTTISGYQNITWDQDATYAGSVGVGTSQYQTRMFGEAQQITRFAADEGGAIVLTSNTAEIQSAYVDIVRYGHL